jgi:hypothetical protein
LVFPIFCIRYVCVRGCWLYSVEKTGKILARRSCRGAVQFILRPCNGFYRNQNPLSIPCNDEHPIFCAHRSAHVHEYMRRRLDRVSSLSREIAKGMMPAEPLVAPDRLCASHGHAACICFNKRSHLGK